MSSGSLSNPRSTRNWRLAALEAAGLALVERKPGRALQATLLPWKKPMEDLRQLMIFKDLKTRSAKSKEKLADSFMSIANGIFISLSVSICTVVSYNFLQVLNSAIHGKDQRVLGGVLLEIIRENSYLYFIAIVFIVFGYLAASWSREKAMNIYDQLAEPEVTRLDGAPGPEKK